MKDYSEYIYSTGTHYISNSGSDSRGQYSGDTAGDQTGTEWQLRSWYNRPWNCVLRYPDDNVCLLLANLGCAAALNDLIGYDQNQRDTYWTQLQAAGYNPENITVACEEDCSSGVIANVKAAGYLLGIKALQTISATYTGNMRSSFQSAGFEVLTADKYLSGYSYLKPGDILLNDSHHTCTNVTKGANASFSPSDSSDPDTSSGSMSETADPQTVWDYFYSKIGNAYGVAGLMGNLYAESALLPINLENAYESKLGYTDKTYTEAVDNGTYSKFTSDSAGYGLAQWTYKTRKAALLEYSQTKGTSIGNLGMQLAFLWNELKSDFPGVLSVLQSATSVQEASDKVLVDFENPSNKGSSVKTERASYGQSYYDKYASGSSTSGSTVEIDTADYFDASIAGTYTVTASSLNLRSGVNKTVLLEIPNGNKVQCYGYYSKADDENWLLVEYVSDGTTYTGFVCASYLSGGTSASGTSDSGPLYYIQVTVDNLNIRSGPGTDYSAVGQTGKGVFGITEEQTGKVDSGTGSWGKLLSGAGWVWLDAAHVSKIS